jgi:hypothetical protein
MWFRKKKTVPTITIDDAIAYLNEVLSLDNKAVTALLLDERVQCSEALATHPSCQVYCTPEGDYRISAFGLINGMFGTVANGPHPSSGWGRISAVGDPARTELYGFKRSPEN